MEILVGFIFVMMVLSVPFGYAAYARSRRHKEVMAMIDKGLVPPNYRKGSGKGMLRWGIVITFLGMALCLGLYPLGIVVGLGDFPLNFGPWMLIGLVPTFFGLSLVVIHYVTRDPERDTPWQPPQSLPEEVLPPAPVPEVAEDEE